MSALHRPLSPRSCLHRRLQEVLGPIPEYCGGYAAYECTLCHLPLCLWHRTLLTIDGRREVLCPSCLNGYMQRGGSINYQPEE
jgi:hypothetical protein